MLWPSSPLRHLSPSLLKASLGPTSCVWPPDIADLDGLASLAVPEIKRLMAAHGVSDLGCAEKAHLVNSLASHLEANPPYEGCLESICNPLQCPVCMADFKEGDQLR